MYGMHRPPKKSVVIEANDVELDKAREDFKSDGYEVTSIHSYEVDGSKFYRVDAKDLSAANKPNLELL